MEEDQVRAYLQKILQRYEQCEPEYAAVSTALRMMNFYHKRSRIAKLYERTIVLLSNMLNLAIGATGIVLLWHIFKICISHNINDLLMIVAAGVSAYVLMGISKYLMNWA